jgi:predicted alpha/beta hydrolase family esterase
MKFKNTIILHGTMGSPDGNWFQWLKTELIGMGLEVWLPQLPNANQPSLRQEADYVHAECPFDINAETLIIGHSSGAILALILAQEAKTPIGAVVAVSVFHDNSLKWEANNKLFDVDLKWPEIKNGVLNLLFVHSDNDPYVPLDQAQYVADNCDAEIVVMPGQGHFNLEKSEDYRQFPQLLKLLHEKEVL